MESKCPPDPCRPDPCRALRKKIKKCGKKPRDAPTVGDKWAMCFPQNGIKVEDCDDQGSSQQDFNGEEPEEDPRGPEICDEEGDNSPCSDTINEFSTASDTDSFPVGSWAPGNQSASSGPLAKSGSSGPLANSLSSAQSDNSGASGKFQMGNLKCVIEQFNEQKRKLIQQIKQEDPILFAEYCKCPEVVKRPPRCSPHPPPPPPAPLRRPPPRRNVNCPQKKTPNPPPSIPACILRAYPIPDPRMNARFEGPYDPNRPRIRPPHRGPVHIKGFPEKRSPTPVHIEPPPPPPACPPSAPCDIKPNKNPKPCIPKTVAPKITGDQKKDTEAKQTFEKIKKIELDTVLDRNVHDLSLDTPDRDPTLIADLMNSNFHLDDDPTDAYTALVHPIGRNKLSATDVHHTDPGSMVPKQIPVCNLNQLSTQVLDELEAIFKSQGIAYPPEDLATAETRSMDVSKPEPDPPKPKPPPAPALFKCPLELQPLRVENFFQLRGSNSPAWYPGMMASFPDGRSTLRVIGSPSGLIKTAYTFCKP